MEIRLNANAVVTNSKGEFLLVKLKKGPFAGGLSIPGGGMDPGELSHETAKREVLEETGIEVQNNFTTYGFCELLHRGFGKQKIVVLLHANSEGNPQETEDSVASWYKYEDAQPHLIAFADEAIKLWKANGFYFRLVDEKVECFM